MQRSLITIATFTSLTIAAGVSLLWLMTASGGARYEPTVQILGMLAGLTGMFAERRAAARERRAVTVRTVARELRKAAALLDGPGFSRGHEPRRRIYPRLPLSATDAAITSGALTEGDDAQLLELLNDWRDAVNGLNRRLELTEMRLFATYVDDEAREFNLALHRAGGYLEQVRRHLDGLLSYLADRHPAEGADDRMPPRPSPAAAAPAHVPAPSGGPPAHASVAGTVAGGRC